MDVITEEQFVEFEEIFKRVDKDNDGAISPEELKQVMESIFKKVPKKKILKMVKDADLDGNGKVDFLEFSKMLKRRTKKNELLSAFKWFDKNGDGKISINELKEVVKQLGETISDEQLTKMIQDVDKDGDGALDYNEFLNIMVK